jgi:hypothetical protein
MRLMPVAVALVILGIGLGIASITINSQNVGSCPVYPANCDHTFPGTNIWIGATAKEVGYASVVVLLSSLAVALYGRFAR